MNALKFFRSANAPEMSATVMMANIIWKNMKTMVGTPVAPGSTPTPRRPMFFKLPMKLPVPLNASE
jgi:hypothetical protein